MQNAPREHSAILSTFIMLPFVYKAFVLFIFEWPLKIGLTVIFSSKLTFSKYSLRITIRVSKSLNQEQNQQYVRSDLDPNCIFNRQQSMSLTDKELFASSYLPFTMDDNRFFLFQKDQRP